MESKSSQPTKLAFSVKELAMATALSERMIRRQIDLGELRAARIGTRIVVRADDVDAFLAKNLMV